MKTFTTKLFLLSAIIAFSGFTLIQDRTWGPWYQAACFRGIDFSVRRGNYNESAGKYMWYVKMRNRYDQDVSFNYNLVPNYASTGKGTDRITIRSGDERGASGLNWFLVDEANSVRFVIDKLRFGDNDSGPYAACDH